MIGVNKIYIIDEHADVESINRYIGFNTHSGSAILHNINKGKFQGLIIDKVAYTVYLKGIKINFPKKEFELLLLLASNPGKVFKRSEILQQIWGKEFKPKDSRSLDVHIRMIRKKLLDSYITTIRGVGYKLEK